MVFQWILLRLIRTPDKANKFRPSVGVRVNEVLLCILYCVFIYDVSIPLLVDHGYSISMTDLLHYISVPQPF